MPRGNDEVVHHAEVLDRHGAGFAQDNVSRDVIKHQQTLGDGVAKVPNGAVGFDLGVR